uniref:General secretion pathway protein G n=1 Tax=Magnetococcus massalia (strain MO-1) TaxID=451514 RepID=A0A1S7LNX7_MAGMO|nr:General secretion pathway protein G [Candidatus Magnetococcus massalia]
MGERVKKSFWRKLMGVEFMIILIFSGAIWFFYGPTFLELIRGQKVAEAEARIDTLSKALYLYYEHTGDFPSRRDGLDALVKAPDGMLGWKGPYIAEDDLYDPWSQPFYYVYPGRHNDFDLYSLGADNMVGGVYVNRDVRSW